MSSQKMIELTQIEPLKENPDKGSLFLISAKDIVLVKSSRESKSFRSYTMVSLGLNRGGTVRESPEEVWALIKAAEGTDED